MKTLPPPVTKLPDNSANFNLQASTWSGGGDGEFRWISAFDDGVSFPCQYDDIDVVFLYGTRCFGIGGLIVAVRTSAVVSWRNLPYPRWRMTPRGEGY